MNIYEKFELLVLVFAFEFETATRPVNNFFCGSIDKRQIFKRRRRRLSLFESTLILRLVKFKLAKKRETSERR